MVRSSLYCFTEKVWLSPYSTGGPSCNIVLNWFLSFTPEPTSCFLIVWTGSFINKWSSWRTWGWPDSILFSWRESLRVSSSIWILSFVLILSTASSVTCKSAFWGKMVVLRLIETLRRFVEAGLSPDCIFVLLLPNFLVWDTFGLEFLAVFLSSSLSSLPRDLSDSLSAYSIARSFSYSW